MINDQIFFFFYNLTHQSVFFDKLVVFLAVHFIYLVIALAFIFLILYHKILSSENSLKKFMGSWREFIILSASGGAAYGLAKALKILFHTFRPFDLFEQVKPLFLESGYAFPSGHTMVASAIAFALFLINRKVGYIFICFALIVGISRIVSGVHFPIDILGGFMLGGAISYLVAYFIKKI